jgi:hypothetical protein
MNIKRKRQKILGGHPPVTHILEDPISIYHYLFLGYFIVFKTTVVFIKLEEVENRRATLVLNTVTFDSDSVSEDPTFTMCTMGDMLA